MKNLIFLIILLTTVAGYSQSVKDFSLTNVVNGKTVTLHDYNSDAGVIIIFMLNNCPFDNYYQDRIKSLKQDNVPVILVNPSPDAGESTENMSKRAAQIGLGIPYLADKDQTLMLDLNAHKSTEAFLLKNNNGKFTVFYHGAIDDNPQVAGDVKSSYLKDAIAKMLAGQNAETTEVRAAGCNIRRK
jgi:peroxiredoxin